MAQIYNLTSINKKNGNTENAKDIALLIEWIQSLVSFFESDRPVELKKLRYSLDSFLDNSYWIKLKRLLASSGYFLLFQKIEGYRKQIDSILQGFGSPANTENYTQFSLGGGEDVSVMVDDFSDISWQEDIMMLFVHHFPGLRSELSISSVELFKDNLLGGIKTRNQYEDRLEIYRSDISLFIRDFCPWMNSIDNL